MKLDSIRLVNWRGHADFRLPLATDKPTILSGPNGSGKSSILLGVEFFLTGKNPTGQVKDYGLLREGTKAGFVEFAFCAGDTVRRNISPQSLEIEGLPKKASAYAAEQRLMALAGVTSQADLPRALRPDLFVTLATKDQQEAWFDILGIRVKLDYVEERLAKMAQAHADLPIAAVFKEHYGAASANLDATYKKLYDARTGLKANAKKAADLVERIAADEADGKSPAFAKAPDPAERAELEEQLQQANREMGAILNAQAQQKQRDTRAASLRERLKAAWPAEEFAKNESGLAGLEKQAAELNNPAARLAAVEKELRACEQTCCPTCGRLWEDAADRAAQIMRLTASAAEAKRDLEKERQLKTRIARGSAMMAEQRELHAVRKQLAELAAETTPGKVDATKLDQKIHDLRERLRLHEEKAADATASADWIRRKAEASDEARQLALDVKAIELLVELFGKNGIKSDVTRAAADPVGEQLTATLSQWDMAARLNTDLVLEVQRHGKWRPAHACSDGERMLVALALQVWLAQNSGTRLVMIDRLEALDVDNLEMLVSACTSLLENGGVDHVILSGVEIDAFANVILHDQESLMEV